MLLTATLAAISVSAEPDYPPEFEEFADRMYEYVMAHPEGQDIIEYASCAFWFYHTEQYTRPRGYLVPIVADLWDIEIPYELIRWGERVDPDVGVAWAVSYLSTRHERLSDRLCYALLVGIRAEVLDNRAASREGQG
ncbi:hypothetical protein NHF45_03940 [Maricaulaceae bacterium NA33B04]|nr:hypothetical protein [Maricaulaceae bacterium NA33B04]